jgi:hypothetical protein
MNEITVLKNAAREISSHGLAIGAGTDAKGQVCTASALVRGATVEGKFYEGPYLAARQALAAELGIFASYQAIADWNDAFRTNKDGKPIHYRTAAEVIKILTETIRKARESAQTNSN